MSNSKEVMWFSRAPCGPNKDVYLFWKSFLNLQNKDVLRELLSERSQLESNNGDNSSFSCFDPVLEFVLGNDKAPPALDTIIRFYEEGAEKYQDGLPFIDICLFLNKIEDAQKFARDHKIEIKSEILEGVSNPGAYATECSNIWLSVLRQRNEMSQKQMTGAAELLGFVLRFAGGQKMTVICEMAGRGYIWDSFILMSLLYPDDNVTKELKALVWSLYDLKWVEELKCSLRNYDQIPHLLAMGLKPTECYGEIKANLVNNMQNEFLRSNLYTAIRLCLMSAVCSDEGDLIYFELAKDFLQFALTEPIVLAEFLPAMQKNFFEQAFVVMSDLVKAVLHLCNVSTAEMIEECMAGPHDIILNLLQGWIDLKVLREDETTLIRSRKGINDILYTFIGDVADCSKIPCLRTDCKEIVLLALRIGEVVFNGKLGDRNDSVIFDIVKNRQDGPELVQKLLQKSNGSNDGKSLIRDMAGSVHRCLTNVNSMLEAQKTYSKEHSVAVVQNGGTLEIDDSQQTTEACYEVKCTIIEECHESSSYENTSIINSQSRETVCTDVCETITPTEIDSSLSTHEDDLVDKVSDVVPEADSVMPVKCFKINSCSEKSELDKMFESSLSREVFNADASLVKPSYPVNSTPSPKKQWLAVAEKESLASHSDSSVSDLHEWVASTHSIDTAKESNISEVSHSSPKKKHFKKSCSFSSNFETEKTNIWSNDKKGGRQNSGNGFAGPLGKVSGGFGGIAGEAFAVPRQDSVNFSDDVPQHGRGRGAYRGASRGGYRGRPRNEVPYDLENFVNESGYSPRGGYQRRGAYVPRGTRGGYS